MARGGGERRRRASLGCLFWLALVLLVLVVVLFNRGAVQSVLEATNLLEMLGGQRGEQPPRITIRPLNQPEGAADPGQQPASDEVAVRAPGSEAAPEAVADPAGALAAPGAEEDSNSLAASNQRTGRIFFVQVSPEGQLELKGVLREISYENAPLTQTLRTLLEGPNASELSQNVISVIPPESQLNRVYVEANTAFIDLNEQFRFNRLGREALVAQVKQLVYSATEFPTVGAVQILIDGQRIEYLGSEGVYVGGPLSRDSLRAEGS